MEASELRIGNFVLYTTLGYVQCRINRSNLAYFEEDLFNPIRLSEAWLVEFGFKKKGSHYYSFPDINHLLELEVDRLSFILVTQRCVEPRTAIGPKIVYVHQLQNLYYALTGEELILNT